MKTKKILIQWRPLSKENLLTIYGGSKKEFDKGFEIGEKIGDFIGSVIIGVLALRGIRR